jgi:hypothetical protein
MTRRLDRYHGRRTRYTEGPGWIACADAITAVPPRDYEMPMGRSNSPIPDDVRRAVARAGELRAERAMADFLARFTPRDRARAHGEALDEYEAREILRRHRLAQRWYAYRRHRRVRAMIGAYEAADTWATVAAALAGHRRLNSYGEPRQRPDLALRRMTYQGTGILRYPGAAHSGESFGNRPAGSSP